MDDKNNKTFQQGAFGGLVSAPYFQFFAFASGSI